MTYSNKVRIGVVSFVGSAALVVAGCGATPSDGFGAPSGSAEGVALLSAELSTVPFGVTCVQFALSGSTSATQNFTVTAGTAPVKLSLGTLPAGSLTIAAKAFNVACTSVTASSVASWVGSSVTVTLAPGQTTDIALTLRANLPVSANVDFLANAVSVGAGESSTYAILSDGTLRAWGMGGWGQLGNGVNATSYSPVTVNSLTGVVAVAGGTTHACALLNNGAIRCWGGNNSGQLGNGTTSNSNTPVGVSSASTFRSLAVGQNYACGVTSTLSTLCWGFNGLGQLCNGTLTNSTSPTASTPLTLSDFVVSGPASATTLAFVGNVSGGCGSNASGQLANGSPSSSVPAATATGFTASGAIFVTAAAAGPQHACAVDAASGGVMCAGSNASGQLGTGNYTNSSIPLYVPNFSGVTSVTAGTNHTCALKSDGSVWCWGSSGSGQLGDGTGSFRLSPTLVKGLSSGVVSIAAGSQHTCAVKGDGTVWCWGANTAGQLGDGTQVPRGVPTRVML